MFYNQGYSLTLWRFSSVQSLSRIWLFVTQGLQHPPGFPILHQLPELAQAHVHRVYDDAIRPSHSLLSPSPPAFNLSQHQGLFQWVSSSHQVAKGLESELQHQSFQWIFRTVKISCTLKNNLWFAMVIWSVLFKSVRFHLVDSVS